MHEGGKGKPVIVLYDGKDHSEKKVLGENDFREEKLSAPRFWEENTNYSISIKKETDIEEVN